MGMRNGFYVIAMSSRSAAASSAAPLPRGATRARTGTALIHQGNIALQRRTSKFQPSFGAKVKATAGRRAPTGPADPPTLGRASPRRFMRPPEQRSRWTRRPTARSASAKRTSPNLRWWNECTTKATMPPHGFRVTARSVQWLGLGTSVAGASLCARDNHAHCLHL
jgi:hypothetical protein